MNNQFDKLPLIHWPASTIKLGLLVLVSFWAGSAAGQVQPQPIWVATNGSSYAIPTVMALDPSGNILVAGLDNGDYLTVKYDPDGNLLWSAKQPGRVGELVYPPGVTSIALDDAGNVYVTGGLGGSRSYTTHVCFWGCDTYRVYASDQVTIKYNSKGQRQWVASYSEQGDNHYVGNAIAVDKDGNVYVTGTETIKYDPNGHEVWLRTNVSANSLVLDSSANFYLGTSTSTRKFDKNGMLLWTQPVNGSALKLDATGDLYASGTAYAGPMTKLDSGGGVIWTAPFGGQLALGTSGSIYLASTAYIGAGYPHYTTVKLDGLGGLVWQAINDRGHYNGVSVSGVALDGSGNVYVTGQDNGTWTTLKYDADGLRIWQTGFSAGSFPLLALNSSGHVYVAGSSGGFVLIKYAQTLVPGAPVIAPPPLHPLVRPGDNVTLNVNATGSPMLSYQWRTVSALILEGTNATLPLINVQTNQAGMYSVEVGNALGSAASPEIYVSVLSPLASQTVVLGATAVFRTPLSGGGPAAYQWQFNGANLPGENQAILAVTNVGPGQVGEYTVVVSNYYGNVLTSTTARLTVDARVSQAWAAILPAGNVGDVGQALGVDAVGNVFVTGYSGCGHKTVKYNAAGQELWEACDTNYATLAGLVVDPSGNACVAGGSVITKYASTGSMVWASQFNDAAGSSNDVASALAVDTAGNFYVTGSSASGSNGTDIITTKYDPNGQQLWAARYDGAAHRDDFASAVVVSGAGDVCVCGVSSGTGTGADFAGIKYDSNGNQLWANTYDGPSSRNDVASHLAVDAAGSVYVTGWSPGEDFITDFATIKYAADGSRLWVARYRGPGGGEDNPHGLAVDAAGNSFVTGSSVGADRQYDIATIKYAPDGTQLWVQRYSGPANGNDYSRTLALDGAGNVYVEGHSDSSPGLHPSTEVVTLSYDSAGNQRWVARSETGVEMGSYYRNGSLQVDSAGTVYVADTTFTGGTSGFLTLKYVQQTIAPARLTVPVIGPAGQLRCVLVGDAGVRYTIQASSDLVNWTSLTSLVATASGTNEFTDTTLPGLGRRFYRAVQP